MRSPTAASRSQNARHARPSTTDAPSSIPTSHLLGPDAEVFGVLRESCPLGGDVEAEIVPRVRMPAESALRLGVEVRCESPGERVVERQAETVVDAAHRTDGIGIERVEMDVLDARRIQDAAAP